MYIYRYTEQKRKEARRRRMVLLGQSILFVVGLLLLGLLGGLEHQALIK